MLKLNGAGPDAFILESVTGGEVRGRFSIIGFFSEVWGELRRVTWPTTPWRASAPR